MDLPECDVREQSTCLEDLKILSALAALTDAFSQARQPPRFRRRLDWPEFRRLRVEDKSFRRMFRMSEDQFDALVDILKPHLAFDEEGGKRSTLAGPIPVELRVAATLRYLAGASYLDVFHILGIGISSFYECVAQVVGAVNAASELQPQFPQTLADCASLARGFEARSAYGAFKVTHSSM